MSFDLNKQKMRCLLVLDDALAHHLSSTAGPAYWRGFVLEDRNTHEISALFRFCYEGGERSWFEIRPRGQKDADAAVEELCRGLMGVI